MHGVLYKEGNNFIMKLIKFTKKVLTTKEEGMLLLFIIHCAL